jgi:cytochrome b561
MTTHQTQGGIDWRPNQGHWGVVLKTIHWLMAILIIGMILMGHYMTDLRDPETGAYLPEAYDWFQIHKSFGFTVMGLAIVRLLWRLSSGPTPPLPKGIPFYERWGAHFSHLGLYGLMIAMPITGWIHVSASTLQIPTKYFGLFTIPHVTGPNRELAEQMEEVHEYLAWAFVAIIAIHLAAALKHHIVNRDTILVRMLPGRTSE